ncbi:MAG TPA: alpha/beta hydrolase [Micromonosporaceae bacterium]|jgi:pimeloyl-ACP methyl ester carboxylesterase|nr:alpha/beta hydrolase [Micromonosporaceae bacterium]
MPAGDAPLNEIIDSPATMPIRPTEAAAQPLDEWVAVGDGVGLHVRRWAPEADTVAAPDFVLVHGLSSNARLWDQVAIRLASAGYRAVAVDIRSHGGSDAPDHGYDTRTAASDVADVAAALGITGAIVVGQSWGGNVVLRLVAEHPGVASAVVLVDGGWFSPSTEFTSWESAERALRPPDVDGRSAAAMRGVLRSAHPAWSDAAIDATAANLVELPDGTIRRRLSIPHHMQIVRSMWEDPPAADYPRVHIPVLLMPALPADPGAADTRRARVARAAAAFSDATIREYVGGDHDLHAQQPERVADDLLAMAARLDGTARGLTNMAGREPSEERQN